MKKGFVLLLVFALVSGLFLTYLQASAIGAGQPYLTGTFIQPPLVNEWTDAQWKEEYKLMKDIGMNHLILQWTAESSEKTTIYPTAIPGFSQSYRYDVVEKSMSLADEMGLDIYVGLQLNHEFFTNYANNVTWLNREAGYGESLVRELWTKYGHHPSFKGWYVTFEVDNWNYNLPTGSAPDTNKLQNLVNYYNKIIPVMQTLSPGKPIMTSPFFNINPDTSVLQPSGWRAMWKFILERVDFTVIALQDGVGAGHSLTHEIAPWYEATLNAIKDAGKEGKCELWSDVETFNTDWQPMPTKTIIADMTAVKPYVTTFTSFSFNHYMSPQAVRPEYYQTYKNYYDTGVADTVAPTAPLSLTGSAANSSSVSITWAASTDAIGVVGYNIYRNNVLVKKTYSSNTTYTDTQLKDNSQYQYSVSAYDAAGNESAKSNALTVTTPKATEFKDRYSGTYTYSIAPSGNYTDPSRTKLTDGMHGSINKNEVHMNWAGFEGAGPFVITFDLGTAKLINKVSLKFLQIKDYYIMLPNEIKIETSANGITYQPFDTIGAAAADDTDQTKIYNAINMTGATAQFVRITVMPTGAAWTFIDEIEIWGGYDTVSVTGVELNKSSLTMDIGSTETLQATVSPLNATNKAVTWNSDKPNVARVDGSVLTAVSPGTAVITVTTVDGDKTAECSVTVNPPVEFKITDVAMTEVREKGKAINFTVSVEGCLGTPVYSFYILSDGKVNYIYINSSEDTFSYTPYVSKTYTLLVYCTDVLGNKTVDISTFAIN